MFVNFASTMSQSHTLIRTLEWNTESIVTFNGTSSEQPDMQFPIKDAAFPTYTAKKMTSSRPLQGRPSKVRILIFGTRASSSAQSTPTYIMERDTRSTYTAKTRKTAYRCLRPSRSIFSRTDDI